MDIIMYKSKETGFNGVLRYIYDNHSSMIPKAKDPNQIFSFVRKLQREFLIKKGVSFTRNKEHYKTQENWKEFKDFLKNK